MYAVESVRFYPAEITQGKEGSFCLMASEGLTPSEKRRNDGVRGVGSL